MGKPSYSPKQAARRKTNWMVHRIKFAKQAFYDNLNKRQKKEYKSDD